MVQTYFSSIDDETDSLKLPIPKGKEYRRELRQWLA